MNIENYENEIISHENEIEKLKNELVQLDQSGYEGEIYENEQRKINDYIAREQSAIEQLQLIVNSYNNVLNNISKLRDVSSIRPRDDKDREEINEEIARRQDEIINDRRLLPQELQQQIRDIFENVNEEINDNIQNEPVVEGPQSSIDEAIQNEPVVEGPQPSIDEAIQSGPVVEEPQPSIDEPNQSDPVVEEPQASIDEAIQSDPVVEEPQASIDDAIQSDPVVEGPQSSIDEAIQNEPVVEGPQPSIDEAIQSGPVVEEPQASIDDVNQSGPVVEDTQAKKINGLEVTDDEILKDKDGNIKFVDGTTLPQPRVRKENEKDEEYVAFLADYYDRLFSNYKKQDKQLPSVVPVQEKQLPSVIPEKSQQLPIDDLPKKSSIDETIKPKKGLMTIMNELTDGLIIRKKSGKKYAASNIKVAKQFKSELSSGNYLYNLVHVASATVKALSSAVIKVASKLTFKKNDRVNIEALRDRINKLDDDALETIFNEYRGNRVIQEKFPSAINILLQERVAKYATEKSANINGNIAIDYEKVFASYNQIKAIDGLLNTPNLSDARRSELLDLRQKVLKGNTETIKEIRQSYKEANLLMSGGLHGYEEDMKAASTKLSYVGKRFAKEYDLDNELLKKEALLEERENKALMEGNDEEALKAFIENEKLLSSETDVSKSILGVRSKGQKYYSPLVSKLDYRNDPFIRDIFTTVAMVGAGVSAYNAIRTHGVEASKVISNEQNKADQVNSANSQMTAEVHSTGASITGKGDDFAKGMKAQSELDVANFATVAERRALDKSARAHGDWTLGSSEYHSADAIGHRTTDSLYENISDRIGSITSKYANGSLSQTEFLEKLSKVSDHSQETLNNLFDEYLPILNGYAKNHPQFDLDALQGAIRYIKNNPDAIYNMNQSMVDVVNAGAKLEGLNASYIEALSSLPSDLSSSLVSAAAGAGLAYRVATTSQVNKEKRSYGNEVIDMVNSLDEGELNNVNSNTVTTK